MFQTGISNTNLDLRDFPPFFGELNRKANAGIAKKVN